MRISRRTFGQAAAASFALAGSPLAASEVPQSALRVIAYNIFGLLGWPKQRRLAQQAVAEGQIAKRMATELAKYAPDVINFSESPSEALTQQIADMLGMQQVRFPGGGSWPGTLMSKLEIKQSQNVPISAERPAGLFTRHWGRAVLELPSGQPLIVHSAHLHPTVDPEIRLKEIQIMIDSMRADLDQGSSMLLMGDLNHGPASPEYRLWMEAGWVDSFAKVGKGNGFTIRSDIPKWRIDYVMAAGPIANHVVESRPLFEGAFRLRIANKESYALSDHLPQFAAFDMSKADEP